MAADPTVQQFVAGVPSLLQPYAQAALTNLANLTNPNVTPYYGMSAYGQATGLSPFTGFNPLQMQAAQGAATLGPTPQVAQASDIAANVAGQAAGAGTNYYGMVQNPAMVSSFMSPYMQNVVDVQKQQAISDYGRTLPTLGSNAARVGGLGGTRSALLQSEAQRNLGNQLQGIQATGLQNAYQNALQNIQTGAGLGLQGLGLAGSTAGTLGNLGMSDFYQRQQAATLQNQLGSAIQDYANKVGLSKYQDWQSQMGYPLTSVQNLLAGIRQIPIAQGYQTEAAPTSTLSQLGGALGGLGQLYDAIFGNRG